MDLGVSGVSSDLLELLLRDCRDPRPLAVDDRQRDVLAEVGHPRKDRSLGPPEAGHHGVESRLTPEVDIGCLRMETYFLQLSA